MTKFRDILGVKADADKDAIKVAYRRMAQKYHPDRNPDDPKAEAKFKEGKEAYEGLNEGFETKEQRDRAKNPGAYQRGGSPNPREDLSDLFKHFRDNFRGANTEDFTGHSSYQSTLNELSIPVELMFTGGDVHFQTMDRTVQDGRLIIRPSRHTINIPPKSKVGQRIDFTINGKKKTGVLFPESSGKYTVDGLDLGMRHPIDVLDLIVGTKIKVSHLNGKTLRVTIKPVSSHDSLIRLKGKGLEDTFGMYGDFFLQLIPTVPIFDEAQRKILEAALKKIRK